MVRLLLYEIYSRSLFFCVIMPEGGYRACMNTHPTAILRAVRGELLLIRFIVFLEGKMSVALEFVLLVIGFFLLAKGADAFVDGASGIAKKFGIPELVIGLTIVAMGTSAPEAAVSITGAIKGNADISIGNVVGSNILNILIILGIASVIIPIAVQKSTVRIEIPFMIAITFLFLFLGYDGTVTRVDGIILWIAFIVYLLYLLRMARNHPEEKSDEKTLPLWKSFLYSVVGLVMIILGSDISVDAASEIARVFGVSERVIGLTIVALGTSLPELFTSVNAARKGNADLAIGNIVGSNIFNILFVVGTSAIIIPIHFASNFILDTWVAIGAAVLLLLCCFRKRRLTRAGGILMLACYAVYLAYMLMN